MRIINFNCKLKFLRWKLFLFSLNCMRILSSTRCSLCEVYRCYGSCTGRLHAYQYKCIQHTLTRIHHRSVGQFITVQYSSRFISFISLSHVIPSHFIFNSTERSFVWEGKSGVRSEIFERVSWTRVSTCHSAMWIRMYVYINAYKIKENLYSSFLPIRLDHNVRASLPKHSSITLFWYLR